MRGGQHRAIHRKQTDLIGVQVRRRTVRGGLEKQRGQIMDGLTY